MPCLIIVLTITVENTGKKHKNMGQRRTACFKPYSPYGVHAYCALNNIKPT